MVRGKSVRYRQLRGGVSVDRNDMDQGVRGAILQELRIVSDGSVSLEQVQPGLSEGGEGVDRFATVVFTAALTASAWDNLTRKATVVVASFLGRPDPRRLPPCLGLFTIYLRSCFVNIDCL